MLVEHVKLVDDPEGFAPAWVWFEAVDEPSHLLSGSVYFTHAGGFKLLPARRDWESMRLSDLPLVGDDGVTDDVVQGGSKVVNTIANDGADFGRDILSDLSFEDFLSGFLIHLSDDAVGVSLIESVDSRLKIVDVLVGPFDLRANTGQGVSLIDHGENETHRF